MKYANLVSIIGVADQPGSNGPNLSNGATGWELALVTAPSSNESTTVTSKLVLLGFYSVVLLSKLFNF